MTLHVRRAQDLLALALPCLDRPGPERGETESAALGALYVTAEELKRAEQAIRKLADAR